MKRIILGMALGLSAMAAPALATPFALGDLSGATSSFNGRATGGTSLSDTYTFTLSQASIVHISLTDTKGLNGLSASLYDSGNALTTQVGPLSLAGNRYADWQSTTALGVGTYTVNVVGTYTGSGKYALILSSDVAAPVPGPAGFIVAGAGALIVAASKRRKARLALA